MKFGSVAISKVQMMPMQDGDYLVSITRNGQTYMFIYRDGMRTDMLRQIGKMAADPSIDFSWYDAALVSQRIRQTMHDEPVAVAPVASRWEATS